MNGKLFQNWLIIQLIPALVNIAGKCVVIIDNALYYSMQVGRLLKDSNNKSQMQEWLIDEMIKIEDNVTKQ